MRYKKSNIIESPEGAAIALHELTQRVSDVVNQAFPYPLWVVGEISDLHVGASGHCYLQLIEKDQTRGTVLAQVRAMIWANRWWLIRDGFEQQTGQRLENGLKVMLQVQVNMHPQYGLSLNILNFDPTYTLGEMARRRLEILRQLKEDGVLEMNKQLPFPTLPQRIAVVSAEGAAGYGDFKKQLSENSFGLKFYCHLFPAVMQGEQTETSVMEALERIYEHQDAFDVVVIIRGGGATVDLASFDNYNLASAVAQFPLPILVGIGHDRDETVLDHVAHHAVKTPTAAAALLIERLTDRLVELQELEQNLRQATEGIMERERLRLQRAANAVRGTHVTLQRQLNQLEMTRQKLTMNTRQRIDRETDKLDYLSRTVRMAQPDNILKRGFSIVRKNGHAIKAETEVNTGDEIWIETSEGSFSAKRS